MTDDQEKTLAYCLSTFNLAFPEKFRKGDAEHGGVLSQMQIERLVREAQSEAMDLWCYLAAIQIQLERAKRVLPMDSGKPTGTVSPEGVEALTTFE